MGSRVNLSTFTSYLFHHKGYPSLIPKKATDIKICNLSRLHGGVNDLYAFSVTFSYKGKEMTLELVLKLYKEKETAKREYYTLKALMRASFPVPQVYVLEMNEKLLGAPFIIMERIKGKSISDYMKHLSKKEILDFFESFAEDLAILHKLDIKAFSFLRRPKDEYDYAKKQSLKGETWAKDMIKGQDFNLVTKWLEANAHQCPCHCYSLLHGDMNPKNFLITNEKKTVFLDWTWAEIGDPLMDLGYVYYHIIQYLFDEKDRMKIFSHLLKHYLRKSCISANRFSLRFYIVSAGLREAIFLKHQSKKLLNPFSLAKIFGAKFFPALPFIYWRYRFRFKKVQHILKSMIVDYETAMFGTFGGKVLSALEINDILRFLNPASCKLILDVGTGSGRIAREILKRSNVEVIGVDISKSNVESAKVRASTQNLSGYEVIVADGEHLPFRENIFDGIICIRTLKYFKNYERAISEMSRVLKPNKVFVLDLSSPSGYEVILRYITPSLSARGSHVFNFYKMRNVLELYKLSSVSFVPLQKIPYKIWEFSENNTFLQLLIIGENILRRITPLLFSRSILIKCIKKNTLKCL